MEKLGAGASQQAYSRFIYELNNMRLVIRERPGLRNKLFGVLLFFIAAWTQLFGAIGFFLRKHPVRATNVLYILVIVSMGISGFVGFPTELLFGLLGVWLSQMISQTGLIQLVLEKGMVEGWKEYLRMFPGLVPFFMFHILTYAPPAVRKGMKADAHYGASGRGPGLEHEGVLGSLCSVQE